MSQAGALSRLVVVLICAIAARAMTNQPLDVPFITQEKNGCGAASVAMVVHYWGNLPAKYPVVAASPERVYQQLYDAERKGILLSDMKRYVEELGFNAFTLNGKWTDLERHLAKGRPIIVGLKRNRAKGMHFAVVVGVDATHVWLNDPTRKKANRVKQAEFRSHWELADSWMLLATPRPG